jgi:hypothetical protein
MVVDLRLCGFTFAVVIHSFEIATRHGVSMNASIPTWGILLADNVDPNFL